MTDSTHPPFFRKEVLEARRQGWLGHISLAQPLRWQVLAGAAMALATVALCILFFASYTARSRVVGELVADGPRLQAQLSIPSHAVDFIQPGDRILLRYRAFPYQKFGHQAGRVASISRSPMAPTAGHSGDEPVYRVLLDLERQQIVARGEPRPLRPGMLLDADILGEQRRLYQWVFEPLVP